MFDSGATEGHSNITVNQMAPSVSSGAIKHSKTEESELTQEEEENSILPNNEKDDKNEPQMPHKMRLVWRNIIILVYSHTGALYGVYLIFTSAKIATTLFALILGYMSLFGVTAGVHRLWSHRTYKATLPLRLILVFLHTIAFQETAIGWCREHRMHHKYSDTNADPHNASRGFFFSHVGWLMIRKHSEVIEKGKGIDMSDLYADPILRFQKKYYLILMPLLSFILPPMIPMYFWNETWSNAYYICSLFRWVLIVNITWSVNSVAHMFGNRPYTGSIYPRENRMVAIATIGEGWHNYHHSFPWDYKTSEFGTYSLNFTTAMIDFFALLGWAYDLKTAPLDMIKARVQRTGDGSHEHCSSHVENQKEERSAAMVVENNKRS